MATVATPSPSVPLPAWAATNSPPSASLPAAHALQPSVQRLSSRQPLANCLPTNCRIYMQRVACFTYAAAGEQPHPISHLPSAVAAPRAALKAARVYASELLIAFNTPLGDCSFFRASSHFPILPKRRSRSKSYNRHQSKSKRNSHTSLISYTAKCWNTSGPIIP